MENKSGNYFKIVATKEKRGIYFTVVPCQWEKNGTLSWPEHVSYSAREELRSNAASEPEPSWAKYPCVVKCKDVNNFKEALNIEKQLSICLDTDAEEELFENYLHAKKQKSLATKPIIIADRNSMFDTLENIQEPTTSGNNSSKVEILSHDIIRPTSVFISTEVNKDVLEQEERFVRTLFVDADGTTVDMGNVTTESSTLDMVNSNGELASLKNEIRQLKDDFRSFKDEIRQQIREDYVKVVLSLDKLFRLPSTEDRIKNILTELPEREDFLKNEKFSLETCDEISIFEDKIRNNPAFRQQLVEFLSKVGGRTGVEDGTKLAYKLVDMLFKPDVLTKYSWTGVSRKKNDEKKPFQSNDGILGVFFEVISLADNRHTQNKNCNIFKDGVLKHAKKRSSRKRRAGEGVLPEINDENCEQDDNEESAPDDMLQTDIN